VALFVHSTVKKKTPYAFTTCVRYFLWIRKSLLDILIYALIITKARKPWKPPGGIRKWEILLHPEGDMRKWMGRIWKNSQIFAPNICFRGAETLGYVVKLCENAIKITPAGGYPGGADISPRRASALF